MAKIYAVSMSMHVGFWLKADSKEDAIDWLQTHSIEDVLNLTSNYDKDFDEYIDLDESCTMEEGELPEGEYIDANEEE